MFYFVNEIRPRLYGVYAKLQTSILNCTVDLEHTSKGFPREGVNHSLRGLLFGNGRIVKFSINC